LAMLCRRVETNNKRERIMKIYVGEKEMESEKRKKETNVASVGW
jgi:hypothetical protein